MCRVVGFGCGVLRVFSLLADLNAACPVSSPPGPNSSTRKSCDTMVLKRLNLKTISVKTLVRNSSNSRIVARQCSQKESR